MMLRWALLLAVSLVVVVRVAIGCYYVGKAIDERVTEILTVPDSYGAKV